MNIRKKTIEFARKFMGGHHDYGHYFRAATFARQIWEKEGGDWDIIFTAIWLHDIGRPKNVANHPRIGAEMAKEFLTKIDFPSKKIKAVVNAIRLHDTHCKKQVTLEEKIVYDADRLDCFTYSGLIRCFLERHINHSITLFPVLVELEEGYLKLAFNSLNTKTARKIAQQLKEKVIDQFFKELKLEQDISYLHL